MITFSTIRKTQPRDLNRARRNAVFQALHAIAVMVAAIAFVTPLRWFGSDTINHAVPLVGTVGWIDILVFGQIVTLLIWSGVCGWRGLRRAGMDELEASLCFCAIVSRGLLAGIALVIGFAGILFVLGTRLTGNPAVDFLLAICVLFASSELTNWRLKLWYDRRLRNRIETAPVIAVPKTRSWSPISFVHNRLRRMAA
ncbi:MAG: hypothetical protein AAFY64_08485 [Pseudomonadota bacterium]